MKEGSYEDTKNEAAANDAAVKSSPGKTRSGAAPSPVVSGVGKACSRCGWKACRCSESGVKGGANYGTK